MRRDWVHAEGGFFSFADPKSDSQIRAIGSAPVQVLQNQPARKDCPYVLPSGASDGCYTVAKAWLETLCAQWASRASRRTRRRTRSEASPTAWASWN